MERKILSEEDGGHQYLLPGTTHDCQFDCGCWIGSKLHGGPSDLDPLGKCPNNPRNRDSKILQTSGRVGHE